MLIFTCNFENKMCGQTQIYTLFHVSLISQNQINVKENDTKRLIDIYKVSIISIFRFTEKQTNRCILGVSVCRKKVILPTLAKYYLRLSH